MPLPKDIQEKRKRALVKYEDFWHILQPELIEYRGSGTYVYHNKVSDIETPGQIRTIEPMNLYDPFTINKFEIKLQKQGHGNTTTIGICDSLYPTEEFLPGWEAEKGFAVGIDAAEGMLYDNSDQGEKKYGSFAEGDVMKCVLIPSGKYGEVVVEFYRNSMKLTEITCKEPTGGFYGVIGMASSGEEIVIGQPEREEIEQCESYFEILSEFVGYEGDGVYKYIESQQPLDYSQTMAVGTVRSHSNITSGTLPCSMKVQLLDKGKESAIAMGLCSFDYPIDCLPGWKDDSAAYHVDISSVLYSSSEKDRVAVLSVGQVLECTVEPIDGSTKEVRVIFRKDGDILSKSKMWCPSSGLYWCLGMMSSGEKVRILLPRKTIPIELPHSCFDDIWYIPQPNVVHVKSGVCVHSTHSDEIGILRSKKPIDPLSPYPFYEIKIIDPGTTNQITLGVCEKEYPFSIIPGFSGRSIGFHCNEGSIHQSSVFPEMTNHPCNPGDVVRCVVEPVDGSPKRVQVSFLVNGAIARKVIDWTPPGGFYAQIGFSSGEVIQLACPLMRPSILKSGTDKPKFLLNEFQKPTKAKTAPVTSSPPLVSSSSTQYSYHPPTCSVSAVGRSDEYETFEVEYEPPTQPDVQELPKFQPIQHEVDVMPMCDDPLYRVLHNVSDVDGVFHSIQDGKFGFVVCKKQVSEKLPYFEVEIVSLGPQGVAVGLSNGKIQEDRCLGQFNDSIAFITSSSLVDGGKSSSISTLSPVKEGDIIGCLVYSQINFQQQDACKNLCLVSESNITFYRNAAVIGKTAYPISGNYMYPTVCLLDSSSRVRVSFQYGLVPDSYFEFHEIPDNYLNFPMPALNYLSSWRSVQGCGLTQGEVTILTASSVNQAEDRPAIAQNSIPFTLNDCYFEVQLLNPSSYYKILCIGTSPFLSEGSDNLIPGEVVSSVGFMPLTGLIMRSKEVASYVPESVVEQAVISQGNLKVGVGIRCVPKSSSSAYCFFTINGQEVGQVVIPVQSYGLHPTIAFLYHSSCFKSSFDENQACQLSFPMQWPGFDSQVSPLGVARISANFTFFGSTYIIDNTEPCVNAIQGSMPVSPTHPFFEVTVVNGGTNFDISVGLATPQCPLDQHIGLNCVSIGYHIAHGCLVQNMVSTQVSPVLSYVGVRIGCGAIFASDGSKANAEVFFTANSKVIVRRLVTVPPGGFFPMVAMNTVGGMLELDLVKSVNPFSDLEFATSWHILDNVLFNESKLQLISHAHFGFAQLSQVAGLDLTIYFTVQYCESLSSEKILIGFSNCSDSPLSPKVSNANQSTYLEISSAMLISIQNGYRKSEECFTRPSTTDVLYGCGIKPLSNSHSALLFFTVDNQIIYSVVKALYGLQLRPSICLIGTKEKLYIDACARWPPLTCIGSGWGRYKNLKITDGNHITYDSTTTGNGNIGFAQACSPFLPSWNYFEVEIKSRDPKKAIAMGVASNRYNMRNWVGWKKESLGYHADDGRLFKSNGLGHNFGPKLYKGDMIGCGVNFKHEDHSLITSRSNKEVEVFFTVNGNVIGTPQLMLVPEGGLFPTVCIESSTESVCVFFDSQYPSSLNKMSKVWARAFCVVQAGNKIEHEFKTSKPCPNLSQVPAGFCQSGKQLTNENPSFEIEVADCDDRGKLSIGLAVLQSNNSTRIQSGSVLFSILGQVSVKQQSSSYPAVIATTQKCEVKDRIGCRVEFGALDKKMESIVFTRNGTVVTFSRMPQELIYEALYPTIVLTSPADSVIPMLNGPLPSFSQIHHTGWLRSERVSMKGTLLEYSGDSKDVGVAQISEPLSEKLPFYEIEVLDLGEKSCLSIGAASVHHSLAHQPGWIHNSIGCHGDDGCLYSNSGIGFGFGPKWKCGDVIGLGVRLYSESMMTPGSEVQIFITRNGNEIGHTTVEIPSGGFFPTIGLHSRKEKMKVNTDCYQENTKDVSRLKWRTLCGVKMAPSCTCNADIFQFLECERRIPLTIAGLTCGLGLAISHKPYSQNLQYFEVEILNYGKHRAIAVGAVCKNYSPDSVPGWSRNSVAYHTDTGNLHHASGQGKRFGPIAHVGDKIGCGFIADPGNTKTCSIFFTRNGSPIGHHVQSAIPAGGYYPAVGLVCPKDKVLVRLINETYKPSVSPHCLVGLMRIHNCSYSDNILSYTSGGMDGLANAHFAVSLNSARNYFSVCPLSLNDCIRIGLASKDYPLTHSPGNSSFSVAYDIVNGTIKAVFGSDIQAVSAPACVSGNIVGCGITTSETENKSSNYNVFFTLNGHVIQRLKLPHTTNELFPDLYPVVGFIPDKKQSSVYMDWSMPIFEQQNIL